MQNSSLWTKHALIKWLSNHSPNSEPYAKHHLDVHNGHLLSWKNWKKPRCVSIDDQEDKYYTMGYYSAIKGLELCFPDILTYCLLLSQWNQSQKICSVWLHTLLTFWKRQKASECPEFGREKIKVLSETWVLKVVKLINLESYIMHTWNMIGNTSFSW